MDDPMVGRKPIQTTDLAAWKRAGKRFAMLTAYDYTTASWLDQAGIPVLLVGDSLGGVVLGHRLRDGAYDTIPVTLDALLLHAQAVARGAVQALLVGDLPFLSYHLGLDDATRSAGRLLQEGGMQAVKLEGGGPKPEGGGGRADARGGRPPGRAGHPGDGASRAHSPERPRHGGDASPGSGRGRSRPHPGRAARARAGGRLRGGLGGDPR